MTAALFQDREELQKVTLPSTLIALDNDVLRDCTLDWMLFIGDEPKNADMGETEWANNVTAKLYYPNWLESWDSYYLDLVGCDMTYIPYEQGKEPVWSGDSPLLDVPVGSFYAAPVAWAVETGVTAGLTATTFGPNAACNRAQVVTFLYRCYNK